MTDHPITNPPDSDKYLPLYLLVSGCKGEPTVDELREIVKCVLENFKEPDNKY